MSGPFVTVLSRVTGSRLAQVSLALLLMFFPTALVRSLANVMGHAIAPGARIGFSWVRCNRLYLSANSRIGHLNILLLRRVVLRQRAQILHMNICRGPLSLRLDESACLGNNNKVARGRKGVTTGPAQLWLGQGSKVTAEHALDCTQSIRFGAYSTLAGKGSQIWTHGYVHEPQAPKRYRVDGRVGIGKNVYLGSGVIVTGGVSICDEASIGVGVCVTKSLTEPCFYVSGSLRQLPKPADPDSRFDMELVTSADLLETVYTKK